MHQSPSWPEIETAIRRLDRCYFPFVSLFCGETQEDDVPDLEVIGGNGEYAIQAYQPDGTWLSYVDVARGNRDVDIWVSDQGATLSEFMLCPDLERTLEAVRFFCEDGRLHPDMEWIDT